MADRMLKVNSVLREVVAEEVERMNDSRLELVTVTGVDTAPNLRHAIVYIDVLEKEGAPALEALGKASRRIQSAIASQVRLKYTPTLEFKMDPGVVAGVRIEEILRQIHSEEE